MAAECGEVIGNWTILADLGTRTKNFHRWVMVQCTCGVVVERRLDNIRKCKYTGCPQCVRKVYPRRRDTHGMTSSREYASWENMIQRCYNPNYTHFHHYGARGITVCDVWRKSFDTFYKDMGPRPENQSLDRIDVNGHYTPENCRWATRAEQSRNRRRNRFLSIQGITRCIADWAAISRWSGDTITYRLSRGRSPEQAVFGDRDGVIDEARKSEVMCALTPS